MNCTGPPVCTVLIYNAQQPSINKPKHPPHRRLAACASWMQKHHSSWEHHSETVYCWYDLLCSWCWAPKMTARWTLTQFVGGPSPDHSPSADGSPSLDGCYLTLAPLDLQIYFGDGHQLEVRHNGIRKRKSCIYHVSVRRGWPGAIHHLHGGLGVFLFGALQFMHVHAILPHPLIQPLVDWNHNVPDLYSVSYASTLSHCFASSTFSIWLSGTFCISVLVWTLTVFKVHIVDGNPLYLSFAQYFSPICKIRQKHNTLILS